MIKINEVFRGNTFGTSARLFYQTVSKSNSEFETVDAYSEPISFAGSLQPFTERQLLIKPEGQRQWVWWKLFTSQSIPLGSIVTDPAKRKCKVVSEKDWGSYKIYDIAEPGK